MFYLSLPAVKCPAHSSFRVHSVCENTCTDMDAETDCNVEDKEMDCACDEGYVMQGKDCVLPETCGCDVDGHYLKVRVLE